jgi:hypothetical protein
VSAARTTADLASAGIAKFHELKMRVLYTDNRRATPGFRGITDAEVYAMQDQGLVTVSDVLEGGRLRVTLTPDGWARVNELRNPAAGSRR